MEIKQTLKLPPNALYTKIIDSVLYDIQQQTGKKLNPNQLTNFSYRKGFGGQSSGRVTITANRPGECYHYRTETNRNQYLVGYDIQTVAAGQQSLLTYSEKVVANRDGQQLNNWLSVAILGFNRRRHFKKMLRAMEAEYQVAN